MNPHHPPITEVRRAVTEALREDLVPMGDVTAGLLAGDPTAVAVFRSRQDGFLAGELCVAETMAQLDPELDLVFSRHDGDRLSPGDAVATVSGALHSILIAERTALNFLCHLSGIATAASEYVRLADGRCRILDTRKTTPGMRALEKAAVRAGGAHNHRGSLSEMVLVKDNHLAGLSIEEAVQRAQERWPARTVEVECDRRDQVERAVAVGADMLLLDNMSPELASETVAWVREHGPDCLIDLSGGVNLATVADYAAARPDFISIGAITHSAPILDLGLDIDVDDAGA
ncbi:MAG: carboxylating nicotinate-nucleotide diphosphorylase [Actinomycetota bacterium]|nr:carboxylating nicotinate-nucleotide diphosphorylase [Actinomycetota bacterium]